MKEINVDIVVNLPEGITTDHFTNKLIEFIESLGGTMGGTIGDVK